MWTGHHALFVTMLSGQPLPDRSWTFFRCSLVLNNKHDKSVKYQKKTDLYHQKDKNLRVGLGRTFPFIQKDLGIVTQSLYDSRFTDTKFASTPNVLSQVSLDYIDRGKISCESSRMEKQKKKSRPKRRTEYECQNQAESRIFSPNFVKHLLKHQS